MKLLGGVIDGKVVCPEVIQEYAKLPGREELLAKLIGSMNAPVSGTVGLLSNLIAGFVRVLDGYKDTLPAGDAAPVEAEKTEEKTEQEAPEAAVINQEPATEEKADAA